MAAFQLIVLILLLRVLLSIQSAEAGNEAFSSTSPTQQTTDAPTMSWDNIEGNLDRIRKNGMYNVVGEKHFQLHDTFTLGSP
jgi:hypothetical protein